MRVSVLLRLTAINSDTYLYGLFAFPATEVRCQEKTRGGLRYEVILGEPEVKTAPPKKQLSPKSSMSVQDIEDKLKAAEERRQVRTCDISAA